MMVLLDQKAIESSRETAKVSQFTNLEIRATEILNYHSISVLPFIKFKHSLWLFIQKTVPCQYINQDSGRNIPPNRLLYTLLTTS